MILRIIFVVLVLGTGFGTPLAEGADPAHLVRIGALTESWGPPPPMLGLRDGLVERGYREGTDFVIGVRFTRGDLAGLPTAARALIQYGVDIIFVQGANAAKAAQSASKRVPIVFAGVVGDPVRLGLVESFARPGGNITGVTDLDLELAPKRLEIFREIVPGLKRVLFPYDATDVYVGMAVKEYREAARRLGLVLLEKALRTEEEAEALLAAVRKGDVDGILMPSSLALNIPGFILDAANRQGIPAMFNDRFWVDRGGLASYAPDLYASGRQAVRLVEKILKGESPASIPVETNPQIEFAINAKTAQALGLTIPREMLFRADRIVR